MKKITTLTLSLWAVLSASAQTDSLSHDTTEVWKETNLKEVVVKSKLPQTHIKGDALVTRIAGTNLEHAGTSIDLLDHLPQVDASDDGVSVVGRGAATIYINGRVVTDMAELTRLQSDEISRVEIVQNPGARYSASTNAVIRIYKKKTQGEGFSVDNQSSYVYQYGNYGMNNLQMNYRKGGLDIGAGLYAGLGMTGKNTVVTQNTYIQNLWTQNTDVRVRARNKFISPTLTLNWQPNENHSLGMRYNFMRSPKQNMKGSRLITDIFLDGNAFEHSYSKVAPAYNSWNHSLNTYYSGLSCGWQIDVNADLYIKGGGLDNETNETVTSLGNSQTATQTSVVNTLNRTHDHLYAVKATATHGLFGGEVSFGTEDSYTHRTTKYTNPQHVVSDNETKINEVMVAGFVEYQRYIGSLSVDAGIRFEHVNNDYYLYDVRQPEQSKNYNDLFPSLAVGMPVGKIMGAPVQLMASYSRDIARPSYEQLRSNVFYDNKYTLEGGNPNLNPQYNHSFGLNVAWRWLNLSAGYEHIKDESTIFSETFSTEHPEVSFLHPIEQDPYNSWYTSLDIKPNLSLSQKDGTYWMPHASLTLRGQDYEAATKDGVRLMNHPVFSLKFQNQLILKHHWSAEISYAFHSKGHYGNSALVGTKQSIGFRLRKSWFNDHLETRIASSDLFNQNTQRLITYNGAREIAETTIPCRSVSLSVRYKFNTARSKYRGQSAGSSQRERM